ncbi:MAG: acetate--CoA ligase family protein [Deltaproteobacteria bacterium]|nr:acetate--CoA ligase family protein [Deltaproteobacteria bacterium]
MLDALAQCAEKRCKNIIIGSSGFAEVGAEGETFQEKIREIARRNDLLICGPNCQGLLNLKAPAPVTFSPALEAKDLVPGPLGYVSQSGAFGYSTFSLGQRDRVGFRYVVSTGNEAVLDLTDFIEFMLHDEEVRLVAAYAEAIRDRKKLARVAELSLESGKPLIFIKVGRSKVGKKASWRHTAADAGNDEVFTGVCQQYGILRADDIDEILNFSTLFAKERKLPPGNRVAIVSTSGGAGVMMVDKCTELGLEVVELGEGTQQSLKKFVPSFGTTQNPVDVTAQIIAQPEGFKEALKAVLADQAVDVLAILITMATGPNAEQFAAEIAEVSAATEKLIVVSWSANESLLGKALELLDQANIPHLQTPVQAAKAIRKLMAYAGSRKSWLAQEKNSLHPPVDPHGGRRRRVAQWIQENQDLITQKEGKQLLSWYGISVIDEGMAQRPPESYEFVLKGENDPQFGPVVMLGMGGELGEIYQDACYRIAPLWPQQAWEMIAAVRGSVLLKGGIRRQKGDAPVLADTIVKFSQMMTELQGLL